MSSNTLSRRRFLKASAQAGGGLFIAAQLPGCAFGGALPIDLSDDGFVPNAFLQLTTTNDIIFYCPADEMGQGIRTGLATLVGEELDVHPDKMRVVSAGSHEDYNNPEYEMQLTGGSNAIRAFNEPLRQIGADTRALLLNAASLDLGIPAGQLITENGMIIAGERRYPYGEFLGTASTLPLPEATPLKSADRFKFIGSEFPRIDAEEKTTGEAVFGIDIDIPDMVSAVVVRAPVAGSKIDSFNAEKALGIPGVIDVIEISSGVAVVAESYWQANRAATLVEINWQSTPLGSVSSATMRADLTAAIEEDSQATTDREGDPEHAFPESSQTHSATFFTPLLAHAPMEPLNATLRLKNGVADLWTGVQAIGSAQGLIERITGYPREQIHVHNQ